jgi:hypothetical protein
MQAGSKPRATNAEAAPAEPIDCGVHKEMAQKEWLLSRFSRAYRDGYAEAMAGAMWKTG